MRRASARIVLLLLATLMAAAPSLEAQRPPTLPRIQGRAVLQADPPLSVTRWAPEERAQPGQTLFVRGGPFRQLDLRAELVTEFGRVQLQRLQGNDSTAVFRITDQMYTGRTGAQLVLFHVASSRGNASERLVLDPDYQVLNRDAVFTGPSLWHHDTSPTSPLLTQGTVSLRLHDFEFADSGSLEYRESVPLLTIVETFRDPCPDGKKQVAPARRLDIRDQSFSRRGSWRRLPDGRIELTGVGMDLRYNLEGGATVLMDLSDGNGRVVWESAFPAAARQEPRKVGPSCFSCPDPAINWLLGVGGIEPLDCSTSGRIPENYFRLVEWTMNRADG